MAKEKEHNGLRGQAMKASVMIGGKSDKFDRKNSDFYPTPPDVTQALIDTGCIPKGCIWEPACGDGHMGFVFEKNGYSVLASDIRATRYAHFQRDFMTASLPAPVTAVVTNPPFNLSTEFIQRCVDLRIPVFAMMLKSQYWHSQKRAALFEKYPPAYVMALTWRPDFLSGERGGAPTMDMLWTVWIDGETDTRYRILRKPAREV